MTTRVLTMARTLAAGAALVSPVAMAHVGQHGSEGFVPALMHLLVNHGYLLAITVVGVVLIDRSRRT